MDKKILLAIALSLATVWIFNYYVTQQIPAGQEQNGVVAVNQQADQVPSGQPVMVLPYQELHKPLDLDVAFVNGKFTEQEKNITVETNYCKVTLSTYGAVLTSLDFKEHLGKSGLPLKTIFNKGVYDEQDRKKGCFLLALDEKTPYIYTFVEKQDLDNTIEVTFKTEIASWVIFKSYSFHKDSYQIDLSLTFESTTEHAKPIKPRLFLNAPFVGEVDDDTVQVIAWNDNKQVIEKKDIAQSAGLAWYWQGSKLFGIEDRYFVHALVDDTAHFLRRAYIKHDEKYVTSIFEGASLTAGLKYEYDMSFYMGPKLFDHLNYVDTRLEEVLSFGWLSWLCKLLLKLLSWIYDFVGNFGLAIILMSLVLKLPFVPFSIYSRKKSEIFQHYAPSINKIRMKYRHDLSLQHTELMKFYKDHNLSPTTQFLGCLPLLIQMPILFALYRVLNNYLDLYQAPFIGWITDLSSKDPYYVLPILMGLSMLWQQHMTKVADEKQRVMMMFMSIFMTVMFANFPAGLVLYWLMNNIWTIGEDYLRKYFFT